MLNRIIDNLLFKIFFSRFKMNTKIKLQKKKTFAIEHKYFVLNRNISFQIQMYFLKYQTIFIEYKYFVLNKNFFH